MEFTDVSFEDYIPGLSKSNEVYFGTNAPLSQLLLKCAKDLKDYIGEDIDKNETNYKNKKWLKELFTISDKYADLIAKELNVEKFFFCLLASDVNNAFAEAMYSNGDYLVKKGDKVFIDFDKIAESEDIVIYPNTGYKYKNAKGKIIIMCISTGVIQKLAIEQIAGTMAHEIGHCFQEGIFGVYKNIADMAVSINVKNIQRRVITLADSESLFVKLLCKLPLFNRLFKYIVVYNFYDGLLSTTTKTILNKGLIKLFFKDQLENDTYKMKDKLKELDDNKNTDILDNQGNKYIGEIVSQISSDSPDKKIESGKNLKKDLKESFDYYEKSDVEELIKKKTRNWLTNFFRSIVVDLKYMKLNRRNILSLTNYSTNQYQKISFYKKYEFFADIFATSYGFGPHIYRDYVTEEMRNIAFLDKLYGVGINHLPMLKALYKYSSYKYMRNRMLADDHGTNVERGRAIYTSLVKELENNSDLTEKQIKSIKNDIELLKEADEHFINERKESGFWYKLYNKLVSESIIGIDEKVDEKILKPIKTVFEESIYQDTKK